LIGVGIGSLVFEEKGRFFIFWIGFGVLLPPLFLFWRSRFLKIVVFCFLAVLIGCLRVNLELPNLESFFESKHIASEAGNFISFAGWIAQEPDVREDHTKLIVETEGNYRGRVIIKTNRYPDFFYGDPVEISCELVKPGTIEEFRYDRYLRRFDVYAQCMRAVVRTREARQRGSKIQAELLGLKHGLQNVINKNLSEPHASFLGGLLYGLRSTIPEELQEAFNRTGTTHIIAISGYNITIVVSMVMIGLMVIAIPRKKAFWLAVVAVCGFVVLVGAQASVVRAALMGVLALFAKQMGRISSPLPLLSTVAVGMVLANPFILIFDAGFQLSFVAVIGLIYLAPDIQPLFERLNIPNAFAQILSETLAAIILTLPLILYQFERFAIFAPFANAMILLAIPWIMLVGFLAVLVWFVLPFFGQLIFWVTWVLLSYVIGVVKLFAKIPFASIQASLPLWVMLVVYVALVVIVFTKRRNCHPGAK